VLSSIKEHIDKDKTSSIESKKYGYQQELENLKKIKIKHQNTWVKE
jgi:hypothetical protein